MSLIICKKKLKIRQKMKCIFNLLTNSLTVLMWQELKMLQT